MSERSKRRIDHEDEVPYTPTGDGVRSPDTKRRKKTSKPSGLKPDNEFIRNQLVGKERLLAQIAEIYRPLLVGEYVKNPEMEACECDRLISVIMSKHAPSIGDVYIAGNNESSQLGMSRETGTGSSRFLLSTQLKGSEIVQIAASSQSCYVLSRDGTLCDWGNSDTGALGRRTNMDDDEDDERLAKQITGFIPSKKSIVKVSASSEDSNLLQVAAGNSHGIALSDSGSVYSWGGYITDNKPWRNSAPPDRPDKDTVDSELYKGAAPKGFREEPRHVHDMPQKVFSITAGQGMSVAILMDGTAVTWGIDTCGELGRGITKEARHIFLHADTDEEKEERNQIVLNQLVKPLPVIFSPPIGKHVVWNISCGQSHMLMVVKKDGETYTDVYGTGLNQYGQLGLGHTESQNCLTKVRYSNN
jgi:regulator of chromosome condensation